jgi:hypothetical protein
MDNINMQNYWTLLRIKPDGNYQPRSLSSAADFFQTQFQHSSNPDDREIQNHLLNHPDPLAQLSLRCYISHIVVQTCISLVQQFGQRYHFSLSDLLPIVLDDDGQLAPRSYQPLSQKILQSFKPEVGSLTNWTIRLVRQNNNLQEFLLQQGLHLISDWAILNDTNTNSLRRMLSEFYRLTPQEIDTAALLLDSYQSIYLSDRRQVGDRKRCAEPSPSQLERIAALIAQTTGQSVALNGIMAQLLSLAQKLRQYRIHRRGGKMVGRDREISFDIPEIAEQLEYSIGNIPPDPEAETIDKFLADYRQQLLTALDTALTKVVQDRLQKQPKKAQPFLKALEQFHCQNKSMGEIAQNIGVKRQDDISRLLKLKAFRSDVRHLMLQALKSFMQAQDFISADRLQALDHAIGEQLDSLIATAQKEAATAKEYITPSLFTNRLCSYLHRITDDP